MAEDMGGAWWAGAVGAVFGSGGLWGLLTVRAKLRQSAPADMATAYANFSKAVNDQVETLLDGYRQEVESLRARLKAIEDEATQCRGENRQMAQRISSLEEQLKRAGIDVTSREMDGVFVAVDAGQVRTLTPRRRTNINTE